MQKMMPMMIAIMATIVISSLVFAILEIVMHVQVTTEEAEFHALQDSYWSQSKAERDTAAADSDLNKDLVKINNTPSELLRLKLVG